MNRKLLYTWVIAAAALWTACEPVENRDTLSGAITADQLVISATPKLVDGKKSNFIELNSDGNPVLSSWNYGNGVTTSTRTTVQVVLKGENEIVFTGVNHDGSYITKSVTVQVDTLINVPDEWGYLCGSGEKAWTWDWLHSGGVWGNGGYKGNTSPGWWQVNIADVDEQAEGEGEGAELIFSVRGASLTQKLTDGSTVSGSFTFDMSNKTLDDNGAVWAKGKLKTQNVTVLNGWNPNTGPGKVFNYDILKLDNEVLQLASPSPGAGSWGEAWFWMFRAKE